MAGCLGGAYRVFDLVIDLGLSYGVLESAGIMPSHNVLYSEYVATYLNDGHLSIAKKERMIGSET